MTIWWGCSRVTYGVVMVRGMMVPVVPAPGMRMALWWLPITRAVVRVGWGGNGWHLPDDACLYRWR